MSKFVKYLKATKAEMKHVHFPSRQQALVYSVLVILISALVSLYVAGFDHLFTNVLMERFF